LDGEVSEHAGSPLLPADRHRRIGPDWIGRMYQAKSQFDQDR
jgi:hypothetical protein